MHESFEKREMSLLPFSHVLQSPVSQWSLGHIHPSYCRALSWSPRGGGDPRSFHPPPTPSCCCLFVFAFACPTVIICISADAPERNGNALCVPRCLFRVSRGLVDDITRRSFAFSRSAHIIPIACTRSRARAR